MKKYALSVSEIIVLKGLHRKLRDKRQADRVKAIILLGSGWTVEMTSEVLLLDRSTTQSYRKAYEQGGTEALLEWHYQGSECRLTEEQQAQLEEH